jgi:hypothetical protein
MLKKVHSVHTFGQAFVGRISILTGSPDDIILRFYLTNPQLVQIDKAADQRRIEMPRNAQTLKMCTIPKNLRRIFDQVVDTTI